MMEFVDALVTLVSLVFLAVAWGWVLRAALQRMGRQGLSLFWPPNFVRHLFAADPPVSRIPINLLVASVVGLFYSVIRALQVPL
jgi:hypothetical protein